jgi:hypothetical protein
MKLSQNLSKKYWALSNIRIWKNPWAPVVGALIIYGLIALAAYWPTYPGDSTRLPGCACGDAVQSVWFLRWLPYALYHGRNPFFTSWLNAPYGANLAQNTLMPLLGFLTAPLTLLVSPIASFNLLAWLAFPLSAGSMFYVSHRLSGSRIAAFVAGLLYGFSPYMVGQAGGHIMLTFVPLPPLIMLTTWEIIVRQRKKPLWLGVILAAEMVAQFFIEPEVLAITAIALSGGILIAVIMYAQSLTRSRLLYAMRAFAIAAFLAGICLVYPILFMINGPQHFTGPNFPADNPYRSDLVGLVVPTLNERFVPPMFHHIASTTVDGDYPESGDYIGVVLFVAIIVSVVRWRRNRWLLISALSALLCWVLSLGPTLVVAGTLTKIHLPFALLVHLPLLQDILPSRLSLAEWLFLSLAVALGISEWQHDQTTAKKHIHNKHGWVRRSSFTLLAIAIVVTLFPRWPYSSSPTNVTDSFSSTSQTISTGTITLAYPFPLFPSDQAMLWQATDGMQFKLIGGYIQNVGTKGNESEFPPLLMPQSVTEWLAYEQKTSTPWPLEQSISVAAIQSYLSNNNVGAIVVIKDEPNSATVAQMFTSALGPPSSSSGTFIWTRVQTHLKTQD